MKIFDIDGPLYKFMLTFTNIVKLNFCWILGTLIGLGTTVGVSTVAAFDVGLRMVRNEEGYIGKQFVGAWKSNFKQGFPLGLINLLVAYAVYLDLAIFHASEKGPILLLIWGILFGIIGVTSFLYAYPQTARYQNRLFKIIRNSFRISTRFPLRTLLLIICLAIEVLSFLWNYTTMAIGVLIGPAALILTVSTFAMPIFDKIEENNRKLKEE
ncbi:MAG: DUF624 domain-containing protein [Lachnospiraceae bacterium]|nr:DUF624 domain-containing protein [Lachnospiraceae bacterium]